MKEKSSEIVLLKEFKKTQKDIQDTLREILSVSLESIIPSLSTFLIGQPFFIPPITAILNPFIKGYASFKDFREFEMVVSFIDSANRGIHLNSYNYPFKQPNNGYFQRTRDHRVQ